MLLVLVNNIHKRELTEQRQLYRKNDGFIEILDFSTKVGLFSAPFYQSRPNSAFLRKFGLVWQLCLSPKTQKPKNQKQRGLGLTLKCCRPPPPTTHPPLTFKHEGGVPQQNSKSKKGSECSPLLVQQKNLRWTARGRTCSSPPCSVRTSSILLVESLSKCQHSE